MDNQKSSRFSWWMMDKLKRVRKRLFDICVVFTMLKVFMSYDSHMLWYSRTKCFSLSDSLLGEMSVPFDLVKKQPKGQQTFALMTKDTVTGSLTTEVRSLSQFPFKIYRYSLFFCLWGLYTRFESYIGNSVFQFTYLDPSEVRSWHPPTPASNKRVEMDRTVMPCGTVVTTITAVKSKPGRLLPLALNTGIAPRCFDTAPHWHRCQSLVQSTHLIVLQCVLSNFPN